MTEAAPLLPLPPLREVIARHGLAVPHAVIAPVVSAMVWTTSSGVMCDDTSLSGMCTVRRTTFSCGE